MRVVPGIPQHQDSPIPCSFTRQNVKKNAFGSGRLFHLCSNHSWFGLHPLETPTPYTRPSVSL